MFWHEALDLQIRMAEWLSSEDGVRFGGGYFHSAFNAGNVDGPSPWADEQEAFRRGMHWAMMTAADVFNAEPIYVEPEMMTVAEAAVDGFMPEPLAENDFITQNGLLILPRSLRLLDRNAKTITWRAVSWQHHVDPAGEPGIRLVLFHDSSDPDSADDFDPDRMEFTNPGAAARYRRMVATAPLLPTHVTYWAFGKMHPGIPRNDLEAAANVTVHRQFQGILRLLLQHLADRAQIRPARAFARRAAKAKLPHEHVTVVRLRRPSQDREPDEPTTVHWSHRWVVGGHWRNQWYPTLGMHRQIWISPYVKGPDEMPLVINKARVFALVR